MTAHRALVVVTPTAAGTRVSGASLRVDDVLAMLARGRHQAVVTTRADLPAQPAGWCTGVAVSYASAGSLRPLRRLANRIWLDAVDSWMLLNGSGLRAGHPGYAARAVRDASRLLTAPVPDLVTWISSADRAGDHGTVRGRRALVLPGRAHPVPPGPPALDGPRLVLSGDWRYPPNADGLRWLVTHVLPLLDRPVDVYGAGPVADAAGLRRHGYVPDPGALVRQGDVHLAPVRFGAGVKRKVLQPLLAGLPVVTTPNGAHGLRPHPLLAVARDPASFAACALDALAGSPSAPPIADELLDGDDGDQIEQWLRDCPAAG